MRRREFIAAVSGGAIWPLAARAQQAERMRRIAVLIGWSETGPYRSRADALVEGLAALGWTDKSNMRLDIRWTNGDVERARALAKELVEKQPDVLVAATTPVAAAIQHETKTIPIVFVAVSDPVGAGFVQSLPRPGANMTGFINLKASMGGKWLELLMEVAPRLKRVALMFNPDTAPGGGHSFSLRSRRQRAH